MKKETKEKSYGKDKTNPKTTIEEVIDDCVREGVTEIITENGVISIEQLCKANCPYRGCGRCPIDMVMALDKMGALWGEMELLQWFSTGKIKCPAAEALISDFLDKDIYTGKELGAHQFAYALIVLAYGAPLDAVKGWLREAVKNGNEEAKNLLQKLK